MLTLEDYKKLPRKEQRKRYIELSVQDKQILRLTDIPKAIVIGKRKITKEEKERAKKSIKDFKKLVQNKD